MAVNNNRADRGKNRKAGNVKLTPEEQRANLARDLNIKPRTKAFVDKLLDNPKISQTEAWIQTHETTNRNSARATAATVLAKPSVQIYKDSAVKKAKTRIVSLVDSGNESIALKASQDIVDRTEGKAVQRSENINRTVEVKLDLSGVRIGAHHVLSAPEVPLLAE